MKGRYNVGRTVIRLKSMNVMPAVIYRKTFSIKNIRFNPKKTFFQIKITEYGNHPLGNCFKII